MKKKIKKVIEIEGEIGSDYQLEFLNETLMATITAIQLYMNGNHRNTNLILTIKDEPCKNYKKQSKKSEKQSKNS